MLKSAAFRFGRLSIPRVGTLQTTRPLATSASAHDHLRDGIKQEMSFLDSVSYFFERAAAHTNISPDMMERMRKCANVTAFNLPVRMDDGKTKVFKAYRGMSPEPLLRWNTRAYYAFVLSREKAKYHLGTLR